MLAHVSSLIKKMVKRDKMSKIQYSNKNKSQKDFELKKSNSSIERGSSSSSSSHTSSGDSKKSGSSSNDLKSKMADPNTL